MELNLQLPVNNLSFGFVSYQILNELHKRGQAIHYFPIGPVDLSSFNKITPEFVSWLQNAGNNALRDYKKTNPTLRLWHINQSQESVGRDQVLLTFFELDQIQETERNILNQQKSIIVTSEEARQVFIDGGVTVPVHYVPLGYDTDHFYKTSRKYYADDITSWGLFGKAERRKSTTEVIQAWLKKFGNNHKHVLNLSIYNGFLSKEQNEAWFNQMCGGKKYFNINYIPYVKTLSELNDLYNAVDVALELSKNEGWSLPSFHTLGLGKHAIVHDASAMRGWANAENAVLVESSGKIKAADGMFFPESGPFNVGNFWNWEESALMEAFDKVLERKNANKINEAGLLIPQNFTWKNTVDKILEILNN